MKHYLGIDLGGTNIATGVIDENYQFVARHSVPTRGTRPSRRWCATSPPPPARWWHRPA